MAGSTQSLAERIEPYTLNRRELLDRRFRPGAPTVRELLTTQERRRRARRQDDPDNFSRRV